MNLNRTIRFVFGGGALLCNVNKKSPLLNSVRRKLYVFLTAIFLSLSCFGEVPHSYVTDNPNAQINKIETTYRFGEPLVSLSSHFIQRNKAQMQKNIHSFSSEVKTELEFHSYDRRDYCNMIGQFVA